MKRIVFSAMAVAAVTAPAAAQEATKFDGPFVGVQLGWQQDRRSATPSTVPPSTTRVTCVSCYQAVLGVCIRIWRGPYVS